MAYLKNNEDDKFSQWANQFVLSNFLVRNVFIFFVWEVGSQGWISCINVSSFKKSDKRIMQISFLAVT